MTDNTMTNKKKWCKTRGRDKMSGRKQKTKQKRSKDPDSDVWRKKFPNLSSLTEEEKSILRDTLIEARKKVEENDSLGAPVFGTVHDKLLRNESITSSFVTESIISNKDESSSEDEDIGWRKKKKSVGETEDCDEDDQSYSQDSSLSREVTVEDLEVKSGKSKENVKKSKSTGWEDSSSISSFVKEKDFKELYACKELPNAIESYSANQTKCMLDKEKSNSVLDGRGRKNDEDEEDDEEDEDDDDEDDECEEDDEELELEKEVAEVGAPLQEKKTENTINLLEEGTDLFQRPRFDTLTPEEKAIFFDTLKTAYNNIIGRDPSKKNEIIAFSDVQKLYNTEAFSCLTSCKNQQDVRVKLGVTVECKDNERIARERLKKKRTPKLEPKPLEMPENPPEVKQNKCRGFSNAYAKKKQAPEIADLIGNELEMEREKSVSDTDRTREVTHPERVIKLICEDPNTIECKKVIKSDSKTSRISASAMSDEESDEEEEECFIVTRRKGTSKTNLSMRETSSSVEESDEEYCTDHISKTVEIFENPCTHKRDRFLCCGDRRKAHTRINVCDCDCYEDCSCEEASDEYSICQECRRLGRICWEEECECPVIEKKKKPQPRAKVEVEPCFEPINVKTSTEGEDQFGNGVKFKSRKNRSLVVFPVKINRSKETVVCMTLTFRSEPKNSLVPEMNSSSIKESP